MRTLDAILCIAIALAPLACERSKPTIGAQPPAVSAPPSRAAPPAPAAAAARVTAIELGTAVDPEGRVPMDARKTTFAPSDTIYVSVLTDSPSSSGGTVSARWSYEDGQLVSEGRETLESSDRSAEFHIAKPDGWPAGRYRVEIALDDQPAGTREFEVR